MPVLLFLNELSYGSAASAQEVDEAMSNFVELLRIVRRWRADLALITQVGLKSIELAKGYYIGQWIGSSAMNHDRWLFIRTIQGSAPFSSVFPDNVDDAYGDVEYKYDQRPAEAIGAAHLLDGLVVSLCLDVTWDRPWLVAERLILEEKESGELEIRNDSVDIRHAATKGNVESHEIWVREAGKDRLSSGAAIWDNREGLFPCLTFLPDVEVNLRGLEVVWIRPVLDLLIKLEQAISEWRIENTPYPDWKTNITPESDSRRHLCMFTDLDGELRLFELHGRFRPGPGRLHFRLVPEDRTARVAYIGRKLGI
jgi:hypothetical protein